MMIHSVLGRGLINELLILLLLETSYKLVSGVAIELGDSRT